MLANRVRNLRKRVLIATVVAMVASPIVLGMFYFRERLAKSLAIERNHAYQREMRSFQETFEQSLSVMELQISAIAGDSDMYLASRSVLFINNALFLLENIRTRNPLVEYVALLNVAGDKIVDAGRVKISPSCKLEGWHIENEYAVFCTPLRGYQDTNSFLLAAVSLPELLEKVRSKVNPSLEAKIVAHKFSPQLPSLGVLPNMALSFSESRRPEQVAIDTEMAWLGLWISISLGSLFLLMTWLFRLEQRSARLEQERMRKELHAVRARLNPHFLFNALNSIVNSIEIDPPQASEMVAGLSALYRKVTHSTAHDTHSMRDELEIVELYLEIEKLRFGERLHWRANVAETFLSCTVPTLAVQLMVENAIKHGISKSREGGEIFIAIERSKVGWIRVRVINTGGTLATRLALGTGLGTLQNVLKMLYGDEATFALNQSKNGETVAEFAIPERSIP